MLELRTIIWLQPMSDVCTMMTTIIISESFTQFVYLISLVITAITDQLLYIQNP